MNIWANPVSRERWSDLKGSLKITNWRRSGALYFGEKKAEEYASVFTNLGLLWQKGGGILVQLWSHGEAVSQCCKLFILDVFKVFGWSFVSKTVNDILHYWKVWHVNKGVQLIPLERKMPLAQVHCFETHGIVTSNYQRYSQSECGHTLKAYWKYELSV